ncbi:segregation and condensation protein A [Ructibacterium gallinarum]|uniref:Segregation and condensation protein A n=1 Tax=Ructibacterium gallinarum TaxID=2779355 RepID=A0A9D5M2B7_9FIRM|nr:segregation/condensation protein A [Ructibacterium gallinarum]MBE5039320.1 segregation/condensation protein A [Ructibacterium gallinarum]
MDQLQFKLEHFEGPLDLLLTLIRKNKVSIYDIPISVILDQYLAVMQEMQEMDLEVSSEFLVLAATLLQIKSKMLLPKPEAENEEEGDPREELVRRLVEYHKVKEAAAFFCPRQWIGASMFFKAPDALERPPADWNYTSMTGENLVAAYKRAYQKMERKQPPPRHSFAGIVGHEKVSVRVKVRGIWKRLLSRGKMMFRDLFRGIHSRPEAVASFLAVLELIKMKKIRVEYGDEKNFANPKIVPNDTGEEMDFTNIAD